MRNRSRGRADDARNRDGGSGSTLKSIPSEFYYAGGKKLG
jgi:hypothetical protein